MTASDSNLQEIKVRYPLDYLNAERYCLLIEIFISLFEYLTMQSQSKTYY